MQMNLDNIAKFVSTTLVAAGLAVAVGAVHAQECLLPAHECTSDIQEDVYDGGIVDRVRFKNYCTSTVVILWTHYIRERLDGKWVDEANRLILAPGESGEILRQEYDSGAPGAYKRIDYLHPEARGRVCP